MINDAVTKFHSSLDDLEKYSLFLNKLRDPKVVNQNMASTLLYSSHLKKFETNGFVISLYGAFENFNEEQIDLFIIEFVKFHDNFSEYPKKFKIHYKNLLVKYISEERQLKHIKYDINGAVKYLSDAIVNDFKGIDSSVFRFHQRNFSINEIDKFWRNLLNEKMSELLLQDKECINLLPAVRLGAVAKNFLPHQFFELLDQLVIARNEIAHSGFLDEIYDDKKMNDYVKYFKTLSLSISNVLNRMLETLHLKSNFKQNNIDQIKCNGTSYKGTVLKLELKSKQSICIDDELYILKTAGSRIYHDTLLQNIYSWEKVLINSIQINSINAEGVSCYFSELRVGVGVSEVVSKYKEDYICFVIKNRPTNQKNVSV